jgi:hypothetical protein
VTEDEMGRACSTNGAKSNACVGFWLESQKERDHWEDIDIGGRILLILILEI